MTKQQSTNSSDIIHNGDCGGRYDDWCQNHHAPSYYSKHNYNNSNNVINNKMKCGDKMENRHHHHHHYLSEKEDSDYCLDSKTDDFCLPSPPEISSLDDYSNYNETRLSQLSIDGGYHGGEGSRSSDSLPVAEYEDIALGHSHQPSYAQSEGYHSYVSSSDSTTTSNTPFIDRLRRESEYLVSSESGARDSSPSSGSSSETLKWRGSLTDVCPAIARSARVPAPQRHHSESVLYLEPDRRLFPVSTYEPATVLPNRGCAKLSVAERVSELERQTRDHSELKAIQKKALLSFYERHHSAWKSEPQLSPPPRPPPPAPPSSRRSSSASEHTPNPLEGSRNSYDGGLTTKLSGSPVKESRHQYSFSSSCGSLATGLVGPMIVGPAISVDDWVPARPPKKAHLRARSPEPPPPPPPAGPYSEEPLPPPPPPEMLTIEEPPHAKFNERFVDNVTESWPPGPPLPSKGRPRPPPTLHLVGGREPRSLDSCVNRPGPQTAPARMTNGESKMSYRDVRDSILRAQHQHSQQPPIPSRGSNERLSVRYRPSVTSTVVSKVVRSPSDRKHYNRQMSLQQLPTGEPASFTRQASMSSSEQPLLSRAVSQHILQSSKEQLVARTLCPMNGEQQPVFAKPVTLQSSPRSEVKQFARHLQSDSCIKPLQAEPATEGFISRQDQCPSSRELHGRKTSFDSSFESSGHKGEVNAKILVEEIKPVVEAVRVGEAPTSEPVPTRMPLLALPLSKRFALSRPSEQLPISRPQDRLNGMSRVDGMHNLHRSSEVRLESRTNNNGSPKNDAQIKHNDIVHHSSPREELNKEDTKKINGETKTSIPRNGSLFTPIKEDDRTQSGLQSAKPAQVTPLRTTNKLEPALSPHPPPTTHQLSQSKGSNYMGSYRGGSRDAVPSKDRAMLTGVVHGTYKRTMSPSPPTINIQPHRDKEDVDAVLEERSGKEGRDLVRSLARNFSSVSASAAVGSAAPTPKRRPPRAASDPTSAALHPSTLDDDDRPPAETRVNGTPEEPRPPSDNSEPSTPVQSSPPPSIITTPPPAEEPKLSELTNHIQAEPPPAVDASCQTTPAPSPPPPPSQEEIDCDLLSRHLADHLSPSQHRLHRLLAPGPEVKRCTDYVSGLFRLDIQRRISPVTQIDINSISSNGNKDNGSDGDGGDSSSGVVSASGSELSSSSSIVSVASATSVSSSTSVSSNTPTANGHVSPPPSLPLQSMGTLQQKKEELVGRLTRKVSVLKAEAAALAEETRSNDTLGESLSAAVMIHATPPEAARYALHVQETGDITSLLLVLSARLARVDNLVLALPPSATDEERKALDIKREKLVSQLGEAKKLKAAIDKRSQAVAAMLSNYLSSEQYTDYNHFISMKCKLLVDSREVADKIQLGEEQLSALQETLGTESHVTR